MFGGACQDKVHLLSSAYSSTSTPANFKAASFLLLLEVEPLQPNIIIMIKN
jgi:hypothetical protein